MYRDQTSGGVQSIGSGHSIPWRETTLRSMKLIALPEDSIRANSPITEEPSLSVQANRHGYSRMSTSYRHACNAGGEVAKGKLFRPCCLVQGSQYSRDLNQQLKGRISVWVFLKQGRAFLHAGPELLRTPFQIIQIISRETVKTGWLEEIKPIEEHPQAVSQLHLCVRHFSAAKQRD